MDWEQLRERTLGEVGTSLVAEGAGVTGGFLLAGFVGRQIQDRIKSDAAVTASPTATNKIVAWSANNVPKLAVWYLLKKYTTVEPGEALTPVKEATVDAKKAVAGSIVFDTLVRLSSGGVNPASIDLFGYRLLGSSEPQKSVQSSSQADIQRLIQENSALRAELNKALQRLATPPTQPVAQPAPVAAPLQAQPQVVQQAPPPVIRYQPVTPPVVPPAPVQKAAPIVQVEQRPPMVTAEEVSAQQPEKGRQPKYGFMNEQTPPKERQGKYGFMKGEKDIASMFGML